MDVDSKTGKDIILNFKDMKEKVKALLIKWGNNSKEVDKMIAQEWGYVSNTYPNANAKKLAEIIRILF